MIQNAYVGLGSNLGNRAGYLLLAVRGMLDAGLDVIRLSHIYETQAVENENQPAFLNLVAELRGSTLPSPEQVMARLLRIEYSLGPDARDSHGSADHRSRPADLQRCSCGNRVSYASAPAFAQPSLRSRAAQRTRSDTRSSRPRQVDWRTIGEHQRQFVGSSMEVLKTQIAAIMPALVIRPAT